MEGQTNGHEVEAKKRKLQMDSTECLAHSNTDAGALPLTNPTEIKTSSQDINKGIYPKQLKFDNTKTSPEECPSTSKNGTTSGEQPSTSKAPPVNGSSTRANEAACSSDILDDFENDIAFESMEAIELIEKAESETSSPVKSVRDFDSPCKSYSPCKDFDGAFWFDKLPIELWENIFCRMPILDLCLGVNLVCKDWKERIADAKFLTWKRMYFKYKLLQDDACAQIYGQVLKHDMDNEQKCLLQIIKYVHDFRKWFGATMVKDLQQHHNYNLAKEVLQQQAPEYAKDGEINPWCLIATLAIFAENVGDVTLIINCLLNPLATCNAVDVVECLYCVATFLLALQRRHNANRGLHYRVYHALYLFENSFSDIRTKPTFADRMARGWQSGLESGKIHLTHEQTRIVNYDPKPNEVMKIVAFAGTGKTTTLIRYAERRPHMRFLYVAFNKAVQIHATKVFPKNVTAKTTHSLAWPKFGKLFTTLPKMKPRDIHKFLPAQQKDEKKKGLHWITRAKLVIDTIISFMSSTEEFITTLHVPKCYVKTVTDDDPLDGGDRPQVTEQKQLVELDHRVKMKLADEATMVWTILSNHEKKERVPYDLYLKLYQLSKPKLWGYDCILIDEAQDLTPATQDILLRQSCAKILVGDPNQQIYSFRGANNAMNQIHRFVGQDKVIKTFHLTQSFRFGPEIAYVANLLLEFFKKNTTQSIVGIDKKCGFHGEEEGQVAIICRTNVSVFESAVQICEDAKKDDKRVRIAFASGIKGYGFDMLLDMYVLSLPPAERYKQPHRIQNFFVNSFNSFYDLKSYAFHALDKELEMKVDIIKKYGSRVPSLVADIRSRTIDNLERADIVLSTSHKAKGLEFDTVKLTEDYNCLEEFLLSANGGSFRNKGDEFNMVYVAITRAKKRLVLNYRLMKFLEFAMETFESPVSVKYVLANQDEVPHCLECQALIEAKDTEPLIMKRPKLQLCFSCRLPPNDGYLCAKCAAKFCKWFHVLLGQEPDRPNEVVLCEQEPDQPNECFMNPDRNLPPNDGYLCAKCSAKCCKWFHVLCGQEPDRPKEEENDSYDFDDIHVAGVDNNGMVLIRRGRNRNDSDDDE